MERWEIVSRADADDNALFTEELENDPLVFFHVTPASNCESIAADGFRSAKNLGVGELDSVSYYKSSRSWNVSTGYPADGSYVVFAVVFETLERVEVNESDIHVHLWRQIQPTILGFCKIPAGYPGSPMS